MARLADTILYVLIAPWRCLELSFETVTDIETKEEDRVRRFKAWIESKKTEAGNVSISGTLLAAVVTASIQWNQVDRAHWSVLAFWYGALVLSLFCVIVALHLSILFATLEANLPEIKPPFALAGPRRPAKSLTLFALQSHMLLLSYGIMSYLAGLSVMLLRPLWTVSWGDESRIAMLFVTYLGFAIVTYLFTSSWIYHECL